MYRQNINFVILFFCVFNYIFVVFYFILIRFALRKKLSVHPDIFIEDLFTFFHTPVVFKMQPFDFFIQLANGISLWLLCSSAEIEPSGHTGYLIDLNLQSCGSELRISLLSLLVNAPFAVLVIQFPIDCRIWVMTWISNII